MTSPAPQVPHVQIPPDEMDWPAPMAQAAYYGVAGDFTRLVGPETEADPVGLLTNFLVTSGVMFGREAFAVADGRITFRLSF
jgi:hypothetical protein